jgi:hypothetical protein
MRYSKNVSHAGLKNLKSDMKCAERQKSATPIAHFLACFLMLYHIS